MTVRIRPTSKHVEFNQNNTTWPAKANQIDAKKMNVSAASLAPDSSVRKATPSDITERTARSGAVVETIFLSRPRRAQCKDSHTLASSAFHLIPLPPWERFLCSNNVPLLEFFFAAEQLQWGVHSFQAWVFWCYQFSINSNSKSVLKNSVLPTRCILPNRCQPLMLSASPCQASSQAKI